MVDEYSERDGYSMGEIEKMVRGFRLLSNENGGLTKDTFGLALAFFDQKAGYESISAMAKVPRTEPENAAMRHPIVEVPERSLTTSHAAHASRGST